MDELEEMYESLEDQLEHKWQRIMPKYREKYPTISEEDVDYREGEFDLMTDQIAKRTNRSRDQILHEIRDWEEE